MSVLTNTMGGVADVRWVYGKALNERMKLLSSVPPRGCRDVDEIRFELEPAFGIVFVPGHPRVSCGDLGIIFEH
jgi:hypothetical protein